MQGILAVSLDVNFESLCFSCNVSVFVFRFQ